MSSPAVVKILEGNTPENQGELARFSLSDDGKVATEYANGAVRSWLEGPGIWASGRMLHPKDGKSFFDAIDAACAASSFVRVRQAESSDHPDENLGPTEDAYSPNDLDELHALHQEFGSTDDE